MSRALELKPLLVAAAIGALAFWALHRSGKHFSDLATGALMGIGVQAGVRIAGVS